MEGGNDGHTNVIQRRLLGRVVGRRFVSLSNGGGNRTVRADAMNTIQLTQTEFDALPIHRTPPGRDVATRWKLESRGRWFVASYVEGSGYLEIMILEIEVRMTPEELQQIKQDWHAGFYKNADVISQLIAEVEYQMAANEQADRVIAGLRAENERLRAAIDPTQPIITGTTRWPGES